MALRLPEDDEQMAQLLRGYGGPYAQQPGMPPANVPQQMNFGQRLGQAAKGFAGNRDLALALLANSGYGPKQTFGQALGNSMMQADQMKSQRADDAFQQQYRQAQMAQMQSRGQGQPSSVQEYEYARQNGYKGSFEDWSVRAGQTSRPSNVQEWEFYNQLVEEDKKNGTKKAQMYLEMKRNPNFKVTDVNQVPNVIVGTPGGGASATPLSTLPATAAAAGTVKEAEGRGSAIGTGLGTNTAGINAKASDAKQMMGAIDMAGGLLDKATGSWVGSMIDSGAGLFGKSTEGAQGTASLKVLQASLLSFVPKMSGPQSDADREVYIAAVGKIADDTVPRETRKAALKTVADMQQQYIKNAGGTPNLFNAKPPAKPLTLDQIRAKYGNQPR